MKQLEQRIVSEVRAERELVPRATAAPIPSPAAPWPRYLVAAVTLVVVATGAVWMMVQTGGRSVPIATANGQALTLHALHGPILNELDVLVTTGSPVTTDQGHDVYVGLIEQEPLTFVPEGIEKPIVQRLPDVVVGGRVGIIGPVVYLGEVDGESFMIYSSTANSLPGFLGRLASALSSERLLCLGEPTGSACGAGWDTDDILTGSSGGQTGGPFRHHLVWAGLPPDTAVVSWEFLDGTVFWQRPAGLAAAMTWETDDAGSSVRVRALAASGEVLLERTSD